MAADDPRVLAGLDAVRSRQWFHAHELLELPWREEGDPKRKRWLHGLIQAAVALEHLRRGNPRGAWGQWSKAADKLRDVPEDFAGSSIRAWRNELHRFAAAIQLEERSRRHAARRPMTGLPDLPPEEDWPLP